MLPHPLTSAPCACAAHNNSHCYATVTQKLSQPDEHLAQNVFTNAHVPLKMLSPYAPLRMCRKILSAHAHVPLKMLSPYAHVPHATLITGCIPL